MFEKIIIDGNASDKEIEKEIKKWKKTPKGKWCNSLAILPDGESDPLWWISSTEISEYSGEYITEIRIGGELSDEDYLIFTLKYK